MEQYNAITQRAAYFTLYIYIHIHIVDAAGQAHWYLYINAIILFYPSLDSIISDW